MKFEEMELDDRLIAACLEAGYEKPTNVQLEVIPEALDGMDILADAPTGTGKTAAFLLPCLQHLLDFPGSRQGLARILVLTPTRELALQIGEHAQMLAKYVPEIKIGTIIGGVQHEEQLPVISEKTDIVIATPGRLIEYIRKKAFDIRGVEILVLDEADRMLDMGFIDDVAEISEAAERREQTMLFSATLEGPLLERFANEVLEKPVEIHIDSPRSERRKIAQYKYYADDLEHKIKVLEALLSDERLEKSIVFVKTRERLAELVKRLDADGFKFCYLRGEMDQDKRIQAMQRFANNEVTIMLATDVAARGIDVVDITHVINFDLPRTADIYVHRIGRTARAGRRGSAISLVEAHDVPMLDRIEHYTGETIDLRVLDDLRPQNKIADFSKKKNKAQNTKAEKVDEPHRKERSRDKKNKGKPDFAAKMRAKLLKAGASAEEIDSTLATRANQANEEHREEKQEAAKIRKEKAEATANVLAQIAARRGREVTPPEKVAAQQASLKAAPGINPKDVIIEDDGEDYYDDDDIEMIEERKFAQEKDHKSFKHKAEGKKSNPRHKRGSCGASRASEDRFGDKPKRSFKRDTRYSLDEIEAKSESEAEAGRSSRALRFFDDGFGRDENYHDFGDNYSLDRSSSGFKRESRAHDDTRSRGRGLARGKFARHIEGEQAGTRGERRGDLGRKGEEFTKRGSRDNRDFSRRRSHEALDHNAHEHTGAKRAKFGEHAKSHSSYGSYGRKSDSWREERSSSHERGSKGAQFKGRGTRGSYSNGNARGR